MKPMITLTATYRETLQPETVAEIDRLLEDNFDLDAIIIFIDEHSEEDFRNYYEDYVEAGESHGYEEVDAFLTLRELDELDSFEDYYVGEFATPSQFAENSFEYSLNLPYAVVVDWEATAEALLEDNIEQVGNYYFLSYR